MMASKDGQIPKEVLPWLNRWTDLFVDNLYEYAVLVTDLSGIILTWHPGVRQVLGYEQEIIGQPIHIIFTEEDKLAGRPETEFSIALQEGHVNDERWHVKKDGTRFWAMGIMTAIYNESGEPVGFSKLFQDKTESKELAVALGASESRFRGTFEQAAVGIVHLDKKGHFLRFNHKLAETLGYAFGEDEDINTDDHDLTDKPFLELVHPDDLEVTARIFPQLMDGSVDTYKQDMRLLQQDGDYIWTQITASKIRDAQGHFDFTTIVVEDISTRKQIEATLTNFNTTLETQVAMRTRQVRELARDITLAEQRERQRIAQLIHDELQQQLYALQIALHNLSTGLELPNNISEEIDGAYSIITMAIKTARTLSTDLTPLIAQPDGFVNNLKRLVEQMQNMHNIRTVLDIADDMEEPPDRFVMLLLQVIRELLFNIVKHAKTEQAVIGLQVSAIGWQLEVSDQGEGFDTHTVNPMDSSKHLGLNSIRQRLALFDGSLKVSSTPGQGTTVSVFIPHGSE
jgi:PAS domain S-box-containing protein